MWELADSQGSYKMLISEPKVAVRYINLQKLWLSSYLIDGPTPMLNSTISAFLWGD